MLIESMRLSVEALRINAEIAGKVRKPIRRHGRGCRGLDQSRRRRSASSASAEPC